MQRKEMKREERWRGEIVMKEINYEGRDKKR